MNTIHFVGGEKGGVGKSVVARLLAQLFVDRSLRFTALDADRSHGALVRYYSDFSSAVDLDRLESADQIVEAALGPNGRVLVDLPAQSHRHLQRWLEQSDVLAFTREMNVAIVFWFVTDGGYDSVTHLEQLLESFGNSFRFVVVQNQGRSKSFDQFEASDGYRALLSHGGRVLALPELDPAVMYKLDRSGASFWAAVHSTEGPRALSPLERRRAKLWLERAHAALEPGVELRPARREAPLESERAPAPNGTFFDDEVTEAVSRQ